jgi:hypothetical protein
MNFTAGIALIAVAIVMLVFMRPKDGIAHPFLRVWIVGQIYALTILILGTAGVALLSLIGRCKFFALFKVTFHQAAGQLGTSGGNKVATHCSPPAMSA